jgi:LCP family protein required for cell wall assembly
MVVLGVTLSFVLLLLGGLLWANWKFGQIERVQVSSALGGGTGTNYLFVGSDSREGIDPDDPNAGALAPVAGQRSDTLLVLRTSGDSGAMLSIPRDLFVTIADTGEQQRINAAYNGGPERLVNTVRDNLGIPIHRYVEVDFVSFAGLVDAVGGITIDFPFPARDPKSGLLVTGAGPQQLDGSQALAFVRSRNYIETIDGVDRTDPTADLGRVQRQQQFLRAVLDEVGAVRNPFKLMSIANSLVGGLRIDDDMTLFDALGLLRRMSSLDPEPQTLPTTPFRTSGGAAVLDLNRDEAEPLLQQFR